MADKSKIEWTDATWNPITGCSIISPGCANCYAMKLAGTRLRFHPSRRGLTKDTKTGPVWTGDLRVNEQWFDQPFEWKKGRMIFVCAHGDLFHEKVPDAIIDEIFAIMALNDQHIFQVLTKRDGRMREYFESIRYHALSQSVEARIARAAKNLASGRAGENVNAAYWDAFWQWPLPNVMLGVSVEDQYHAINRVGNLTLTPAACRFVSYEPALGPIDLTHLKGFMDGSIHWLIAGGESGPRARPADPEWFRSIRNQCETADVPFLFKQWGEWFPGHVHATDVEIPYPDEVHDVDIIDRIEGQRNIVEHGQKMMIRVGKKSAGNKLDNVEHMAFPDIIRERGLIT